MADALARAAAHVAAAQRALDDARGAPPPPETDWHAAFLRLEREHAALRERYERDMHLWLEFKRWWLTVVATRAPDRLDIAGDAPVAHDAWDMACAGGTPTPLTPRRRNRQAIRAHRASVRATLQSDPHAFRRHGRYSAPPQPQPPRSTDAHADSVRGHARQQLHAGDCACCRDYYASVGSAPPRARAVWASSPPTPQESPTHTQRRAYSSRHRSAAPPEPTPPDYWCALPC